MDEEELLPGVDGQTFEIRLGEEFVAENEVIPALREEVEDVNVTVFNQMQRELQNEVNAMMNDDNNYIAAEAQLEQLRGMVIDTGMLTVNTQRPPVENIQEVNLGQRTVGRITRDHLQEALNTVYYGRDLARQDVEAISPQSLAGVAWKDTNEERVRRIEDFREELLKLMEDSDGSEKSMKKLKSFIELY